MAVRLIDCIDQALCPVLLSGGNEKAEIIVAGPKIRIINGYGPQKLGSAQRSTQEQSIIIQQFWQELPMDLASQGSQGEMMEVEYTATFPLEGALNTLDII